jgi:hypothetical protein
VAGYAAFIVAVAYPLYLISIYVMALALALLVLLAPVMALYAERGALYLALLVLLSVALSPLHLAPLTPLLIGLWWQGAGSWIGGGMAALWLKLCAAVSGEPTDLWLLYGWRMETGSVYQRFHSANSLQTVALILQPFGIDLAPLVRGAALGTQPTYPVSAGLYVLLNVLQVFAWAAAALAVSAVYDHLTVRWSGLDRGGARAALSLLPGLALIWMGFVALPAWLGVEGPRWLDPPWLTVQTVWLGLVAWLADAVLRHLRRPVSFETAAEATSEPGLTGEQRRGARTRASDESEVALHESRQAAGRLNRRGVRAGARWGRERGAEEPADQAADIMIELD